MKIEDDGNKHIKKGKKKERRRREEGKKKERREHSLGEIRNCMTKLPLN